MKPMMMSTAIGRVAPLMSAAGKVVVSFMFLVGAFNHIRGWHETVAEMRDAGVTFETGPLLAVAMVVSIAATFSLFIRYTSQFAAIILAFYSITVSWFLHNPFLGMNQAMLFVKDLTISGALWMFAAEAGSYKIFTSSHDSAPAKI